MGFELKKLTESLKVGDVTSGNYTETTPTGQVRAIGESSGWDDVREELNVSNLDANRTNIVFDHFNTAIKIKDSSTYPDDPISISTQFPHAMVFGTGVEIRPHVHGLQQGATLPNLLLAYKKRIKNTTGIIETDYSNFSFLKFDTPAFTYVSGILEQIIRASPIDISDMGLSDTISFVIFRDTTNVSGLFAGAETISGDMYLTSFDYHARFQDLGSRSEFVK